MQHVYTGNWGDYLVPAIYLKSFTKRGAVDKRRREAADVLRWIEQTDKPLPIQTMNASP